jgi:predicted ArsR family transcriptional regulator
LVKLSSEAEELVRHCVEKYKSQVAALGGKGGYNNARILRALARRSGQTNLELAEELHGDEAGEPDRTVANRRLRDLVKQKLVVRRETISAKNRPKYLYWLT